MLIVELILIVTNAHASFVTHQVIPPHEIPYSRTTIKATGARFRRRKADFNK